MKTLLPVLLLTVACATPATAPVQAGTGIQRCIGADGSTVYTDKACKAFGATSTAIDGALATRIRHEQAREEALRAQGIAVSLGGTADGGASAYADATTLAPAALAAPARRAVASGCARSPTQLQMDLRAAFALRDVNRIAESYHWVGVSSRGAMRIMDRLGALARRHVEDTHYFDAQIGSGGAMFADAAAGLDAATGGSGGVLQVAFADGAGGSLTDFDVERYKGCYFVRF